MKMSTVMPTVWLNITQKTMLEKIVLHEKEAKNTTQGIDIDKGIWCENVIIILVNYVALLKQNDINS